MVILSNNDIFTVRLVTLVGDYDRDTLINLYQPLVGYKAISLYFTFWSESSIQKVTGGENHESLLAKMQISVADFLKARKALEGVGLLKTYLEETTSVKTYHYEVYAPKSPSEFFNDTLLYGLLINYIGEVDAKRMNQFYSVSTKKEGTDISASFDDIFHPNFQDKAFTKALMSNPSMGRNRAQMKLEFTYARFFEALKEVSQISEKAFSKNDLSEIARLSSLYGIDESKAAHVVANFYDPNLEKGHRLDFASITKAFQEETNYSYLSSFKSSRAKKSRNFVSSSGALAQKINMMETISPKDFLQVLQNGTSPATPDLKLIDYLSKKFRLENSVLNAVIDYTLRKNNNVLSKAYCEKICASLARSGIDNTLDAMNYLKSISSKRKQEDDTNYYSTKATSKVEEVEEKEDKPNKDNKEEISDSEWEDLLAELSDNPQGGDDDGKA